MNAGYLIFTFGLLLLIMSYILYRVANLPKRSLVTARELDSLWTHLGKLMVGVYDGNTEKSFLKDLDDMVGKSHDALQLQSKNRYAEENKKQLMSRLRELQIELAKATPPYRIEIRKNKLHNLANLVGVKMARRA